MAHSPRKTRPIRNELIDALQIVYGPGIVAAVFTWFVATSDPAHEVLLAHLADVEEAGVSLLALRNALLGLVPASVWSASRLAMTLTRTGRNWTGIWLPASFCLLVLVGLLGGFWTALTSDEASRLAAKGDPIGWPVVATSGGLILLGAILGFGLHELVRRLFSTGHIRIGVLVVSVVAVVFVVGFMLLLPGWSEALGPIGVTSLFFSMTAYGFGGLTALSGYMPGRFPLALAILILAFALVTPVFAFALAAVMSIVWLSFHTLDLIDNPRHHAAIGSFTVLLLIAGLLPMLSRDCETLPGCNLIQGVEEADALPPGLFVTALRRSKQEPGVLRVVAAQGGGLYAAYHTAFYLAARADTETDFAQSLYTISGVSGGSIGAGIYWAIRQSRICEQNSDGNCHRDAVRGVLRNDYLSPALAGFFFRDNFDNYIPYSALLSEPIDRGRVLERRFASALADVLQDAGSEGIAPLDTALTGSWQPEAGAPILVFNTTDVSTGELVLLSPFEFLGSVPGRIKLESGKDLTVANGMVLSARFPIVTPPGRLRIVTSDGSVETQQLVDGGYFDNSGVEALLEILPGLSEARGDAMIEVILFGAVEPPRPRSIEGTIGAPIAAFAGAWRARRDLTTRRLREAYGRHEGGDQSVRVCDALTHPEGINFTVSWFLARNTFEEIESQVMRELGLSVPKGEGATADWIRRRSARNAECLDARSLRLDLSIPG